MTYALLSCVMIGGLSSAVQAAGIEPTQTAIFKHGKSSGGKGSDTINIKKLIPENVSCPVFAGAKVVPAKLRFGVVTIAKTPPVGCNPKKRACKVVVSWRHAPAGRANYRIKLQWKAQSSGC